MKYRSCPFGLPWVSLVWLWLPLGWLWAPLAPFGCSWAPFGSLWGALGLPLAPSGVALAPFGLPLGSLWGALGSLWVPLAPFGCPWAPWAPFGSSMFTVCDACRQNQASWNTPPEPPEWCQELRLGAHLPHAPGARMTAVTQTPSNKYSKNEYNLC